MNSTYVLLEQRIPAEARILATSKSVTKLQTLAVEEATERGYGKVGPWYVPASAERWIGRAPEQGAGYYEIVPAPVVR